MDEARAHKRDLHVIFVDYKKAFDSVNRNVPPEILLAYGIFAVCSMYEHTEAAVKTADGISDFLQTESGVLHLGDGCGHSFRYPR